MASDGRDWGRYNDALVRRGEVLLDFSVVDEWEDELEKMNDGKVGEHYSESFIKLLGFIRLHLEGVQEFQGEEGPCRWSIRF